MIPAWKQWLAVTALAAFFLCTHSGFDPNDVLQILTLAERSPAVHADAAPPLPIAPGSVETRPVVNPVERPGTRWLAMPWAIAASIAEKSFPTTTDLWPVSIAAQTMTGAACVAMALAAWLIYWICIEFGCRPSASQYAAMIFALSTIALPASGRLNAATFATPVVLAIVYGYQRLRSGYDRRGQNLMLGAALGFALLVHDLTLLLIPLFFLVVAFQIRQIVTPRTKPIWIFGPFALAAVVFALYNANLFRGPLTGPGGQDVISELIARYTQSRPTSHLAESLIVSGHWRRMIIAVLEPQNPILSPRGAGLFAAMPHLIFAFFGILNLRYDPNTRRPMYFVVAIIVAWTVLLLGRNVAGVSPNNFAGEFLPVVALLCVLLGSFIEYHLMSMSGIILKPAFWLFFLYLSLISTLGLAAGVMTRTATGPEPQRIVDLFGKTPKVIPRMLDTKSIGALAAPGLPNLPITLPLCALALAVPFVVGRVLGGDKMTRLGPSTAALKRTSPDGAVKPASRRSDKERYEENLKEKPAAETVKDKINWENLYADPHGDDDAKAPTPSAPAKTPATEAQEPEDEPPPSAHVD